MGMDINSLMILLISLFTLHIKRITNIMEITQTNQNRTKIITNDGYAYVKKLNLADGWESFECERRRNFDGCKGKIKINGNQFLVTHAHHHAPNLLGLLQLSPLNYQPPKCCVGVCGGTFGN